MSTSETAGADVLVVGAGPTGLAMAIELTRMGVRCRVIDKAPEPTKTSKALAVQARTLEYFDRIGIADAAVAAGQPLHGVNVFSERKRIVHMSFDALPCRFHYALALPQSETERLLTERLAGLGVSAERGVELTGLTQGAAGVEAVLRPDRRRGRGAAARALADRLRRAAQHGAPVCSASPSPGGPLKRRGRWPTSASNPTSRTTRRPFSCTAATSSPFSR